MFRKHPFYLRSTIILFGLILFVYVLFTLRIILVPVAFGLLLAMLLNPIVNRFRQARLPRALAISVALLMAIILLAIMGFFLSMQVAGLSSQLPLLKKRMLDLAAQLQIEVARRFHYDIAQQNALMGEARAGASPMIAHTFMTIVGGVEVVLLTPLYSFLFLYYNELILNFLYEVFARENSAEVGVVLTQTKGAIQSYMVGLLLEALIVATLNSTALVILGVPYAILLGVCGAIVNILPFVGGVLSILLPILIATVTKDGFGTQIGIIGAYAVIQFVDNHFLIPYIVSSRVKINALCSIIIVLLGGAVWGISGMFLSIPFLGVLKIVFDRIPDLKPWGKLLGTEIPTRNRGYPWVRKKKAEEAVRKTNV